MADTKERNHEQIGAMRRKRGRPSGHNRLPLGLEQRRAQNALYERERREDEKAAFAELVEALSCDPSWSKVQILGAAIKCLMAINRKKPTKSLTVEDIRRQNDALEEQIKMLEETLAES